MWDLATDEDANRPLQEGGTVWSAAYSSDGRLLATANTHGRCRVWNAATGAPVTPELRHPGANRVLFSPNGRRLLIAGGESARVWDVGAARGGPRQPFPVTPPLPHQSPHSYLNYPSSFSPDGTRVLTGGEDGVAQVWDAATGAPIGRPFKHEGRVRAAAFTPDGAGVLTVASDGQVRAWSTATGELSRPPVPTASIIYNFVRASAAFDPDGRRLVSLGGPNVNSARVWDVSTGQYLTPSLTHSAYVNTIALSPDARRVVTSSSDGTAQVWDTATGAPLIRPLQHRGFLWHAAFSPDGRYVVTASGDKTARVWDAATGEPVTPRSGTPPGSASPP